MRLSGGMAELVDAMVLKTTARQASGFESRYPHSASQVTRAKQSIPELAQREKAPNASTRAEVAGASSGIERLAPKRAGRRPLTAIRDLVGPTIAVRGALTPPSPRSSDRKSADPLSRWPLVRVQPGTMSRHALSAPRRGKARRLVSDSCCERLFSVQRARRPCSEGRS